MMGEKKHCRKNPNIAKKKWSIADSD